jgi:hypothetical protein
MRTTLILLFIGFVFVQTTTAQQLNPQNCIDINITNQANVLKENYLKKGMMVYRESMLHMPSLEPTPIVVRLVKDQLYQFIFVGHDQASRLSFELFDGKDNLIEERKVKSSSNILYTFKPTKTDDYLVVLYQKKANRKLCGYFGVLVQNSAPPKSTPRQPVQRKK